MELSGGPLRPRRMPPRVFDAGVVALVLLASAIGVGVWASTTRPGVLGVAGLAGLALAQAVPLAWRRSYPVAVFTVVAFAFALHEPLSSPIPPLGLLVATFSVGAYAPRRDSVLVLLAGGSALTAWVLVHAAAFGERTGTSDVTTFVPALLAAWALGAAAGVRRAYTEALEERARLLEAQREEGALRAVADERARIARELHDVVAHHVGLMVVQAGGARRVLDADPEAARRALSTIEGAGRRAMNELRRLLGLLRREDGQELEPQPGLNDLERLVERTRAAGVPIELSIQGERRALPPGADLSAYRIVQEALTNVVKHAGPARTRVVVRYGAAEVAVEVTDDGAARVGAPNGAGHGLIGMRERIEMFGGEIQAGPRVGGGFTVRARLPVRDDA